MPPKGKFKVLFPRLDANVLPYPDVDPTVTICINREWLPFLLGQLYHLRWKALVWNGTEEEQREMHEKIEIFMAMLEGEPCTLITAIRFLDGVLQVQFDCSPAWVNIGKMMAGSVRLVDGALQYDLDGDGDYEVTNYVNNYNNHFGLGLPAPNDLDAACYVAQIIGLDACDSFKDVLDILEPLLTAVGASIKDMLLDITNEIPTFMVLFLDKVVEVAAQITYNISTTTLEFMQDNVLDIDVIKQVSNYLFCALQLSLQVGEDGSYQLVNFEQNLIAVVGADWYNVAKEVSDGEYIVDLGDLNLLLGATKKALAGLILGYATALNWVLQKAVGAKDGWYTRIVYLAGQAIQSDNRNCSEYDPCYVWCYEWDFTISNGGWSVISGGSGTSLGTWVSGQGWRSGTYNVGNQSSNLNIQRDFGIDFSAFEVTMHYIIVDLGNPDSAFNLHAMGVEFGQAIGTHNQTIEIEYTGDNPTINYNATRRQITVSKISIKGYGELPPQLAGGDICEL